MPAAQFRRAGQSERRGHRRRGLITRPIAAPPALVIDGRIDQADLVGLCDRVRLVLAADQARVVVCDVGRLPEAGLETVALLARLQLTARGCGGRLQVLNASSGLHEVLSLAGLCDVVGVCPPP